MRTDEPTVKSADRVFDVLELVAPHPHGLTHAQIAQTLDIPKGSLTQLLRNLVARGYLSPDPIRKTFSLGATISRLAEAARKPESVVEIGRSHIDRLTARTNESSSLNLLRNDQVERVYGANSSKALLYSMRVGDLMPLYATSAGKILLAFGEKAWRDDYLARMEFVPWTPNTWTKERLRKELPGIVRQRLALSAEEFTIGIIGVSRPVFDERGAAVAAVNISVPSVRWDANVSAQLAEEIERTCAAISQALAHATP